MASLPPKAGCCNIVTLQEGKSLGSVQTVSGLRTYVIGELTVGGKYLVIFTDVFGLDLLNTQLVADQFHKATGYTVVMPDILKNDPYGPGLDFSEWFNANHSAESTGEITTKFINTFTKEYKPSYTTGIGYCFGAKYIVQNAAKGGFFDVIAMAHPSFVTEEEFAKVAVPTIISAAQTDSIFTPESRFKSEQILNKSGVDYEIDLFSGVQHGFAIRGDRSIPANKYAAEKALLDHITWFKRFEKNPSSTYSCI